MEQDDGRKTNSWLRYSTLGIQFTVTLLLGVWAGWWADRRWEDDPEIQSSVPTEPPFGQFMTQAVGGAR